MKKKDLNDFKTSIRQMGEIMKGRKLSGMAEKTVKYVPLKLVKASKEEAREIEEAVKKTDKKAGWASTGQLLKKHSIR